ncbi:hypothetical protein D9M72_474570 [compost metagenome]
MTVTFCSRMVGTRESTIRPVAGSRSAGFRRRASTTIRGSVEWNSGWSNADQSSPLPSSRGAPATASSEPGPQAWMSTAGSRGSPATVRRRVAGPHGVVNAIQSPSGAAANAGSPLPRMSVPSVCRRLNGPPACHRREASAAAARPAGTSAMVIYPSSHAGLTGPETGKAERPCRSRTPRPRLQVWRGPPAPGRLRPECGMPGEDNGRRSSALRDPRRRRRPRTGFLQFGVWLGDESAAGYELHADHDDACR